MSAVPHGMRSNPLDAEEQAALWAVKANPTCLEISFPFIWQSSERGDMNLGMLG